MDKGIIMKRPMYEYPAIYNGREATGPLWEEWQQHVRDHEESWKRYATENPQECEDFFRYRELLRAIRCR